MTSLHNDWEETWLEKIGHCVDTGNPKNFTDIKQFLRETLAKQKEESVGRVNDYFEELNKRNPTPAVSQSDIIKIIKGE